MADSWKIMSNDLVRIWFSAVLWVVDGPTRRGDTTQGVMWLVMVEGLQVLPWQLCLLHVASFQKIQSQIARYIKIGEYASIHPNLWWIIFMFISRFKSGTNFLKCFKRYNQFNLTNPQWRFELECVKSLDFQACWTIARYVVLGLGSIPLNTP